MYYIKFQEDMTINGVELFSRFVYSADCIEHIRANVDKGMYRYSHDNDFYPQAWGEFEGYRKLPL